MSSDVAAGTPKAGRRQQAEAERAADGFSAPCFVSSPGKNQTESLTYRRHSTALGAGLGRYLTRVLAPGSPLTPFKSCLGLGVGASAER